MELPGQSVVIFFLSGLTEGNQGQPVMAASVATEMRSRDLPTYMN